MISDQEGFIVRVGDIDDYHVESNISDVVKRLKRVGIKELIGITRLGVYADGYTGQNYISLFFGSHHKVHGSVCKRPITMDEFDHINRQFGVRELVARVVMTVPNDISDDKALELLNSLINVGLADAIESADDSENDNVDAQQAVSLGIQTPEIARLYE